MKSYTLLTIIPFALIFLTTGCGKSAKTTEDAKVETDQLVKITISQFKSDSMAIGTISTQTFEDEVRCNGYITAAANGMAQISTPIAGIVESVNCSMGSYVKKGQTLCMITGNELMAMQQEFTETSARLKRLKSDYERSKSLYDEKIGAGKDFIAIESEYKAMNSKYLSLKLRLELLRLNVAKIEAGDLYASFSVISPINGYITKQNLVLGQFIEQQKLLVEIVDINLLQIQLSVFEKDISRLKPGQPVNFSSPGEISFNNKSTLVSIGKAVNPDTKTVTCIAAIKNGQQANLINQSYIEALIAVNSNEAKALPTESLIKSGKDYYVLLVEKSDNEAYYFRKQKVNIGRSSKGFTEIVDGDDLPKVLLKGIYNLSLE
ncbi:MAG: efflux RND transporter periplasmic adaptor subunit [Bacteroidales bacterium]|nr:efflux RND transporter periplasmic adaptor subunit [Bacteroidales bacterium]